jgi:hypothetical protein
LEVFVWSIFPLAVAFTVGCLLIPVVQTGESRAVGILMVISAFCATWAVSKVFDFLARLR